MLANSSREDTSPHTRHNIEPSRWNFDRYGVKKAFYVRTKRGFGGIRKAKRSRVKNCSVHAGTTIEVTHTRKGRMARKKELGSSKGFHPT